MSKDELVNKFNHLVDYRFGVEKRTRLAGLLNGLATAVSVKPLMTELAAT